MEKKNNGEIQQWWQIHNEMECVQNVEVDIFHVRPWLIVRVTRSVFCQRSDVTDRMEGCTEGYWNGMCYECWGGHIPSEILSETLANKSVPWHPPPLQGSNDPALLAICCKKGWCQIPQTKFVKVLQGISMMHSGAWMSFAGSQELCSIPNPSHLTK